MSWRTSPALRFAAILLASATVLQPAQARLLVAYESRLEAHGEALAAIEAAAAARGWTVTRLDLEAPGADLGHLATARELGAAIALGTRAVEGMKAAQGRIPVVAALTTGAPASGIGRIDLEPKLDAILAKLRQVLPRATRIGLVHNPAHGDSQQHERLAARARKDGITLTVADCDGPATLLRLVHSMKGKVDALVLTPDAELYNAATVKPLVLASIENRVPLVGFSPAFVRAGALVGIYPNYSDTGRQAAAMVLRMAAGEAAGDEAPRSVTAAVNPRVARLLGVEYQASAPGVVVLK